MGLKQAFAIGAGGLSAQRTRMETIASNLVNAQSTRTPEGGAYRRLMPVFESVPAAPTEANELLGALHQVRVAQIVRSTDPPILRHEPGHPDANAEGFVAYPAVDPVKELLDMLSATRSYEANVTLIHGVREMLRSTLDIIG